MSSHTVTFTGFDLIDNGNDFEFCSSIAPSIIATTCDDNGTNNNQFDDTMTIELNAVNDAAGPSNTYEVFFNGTILNPGGTSYGTNLTIGNNGEFSANGTSIYTLTIVDSDEPSCTVDLPVMALAPCSACSAVCLPITITRN